MAKQGGFLLSPAVHLPATIKRNATVWCSCSFNSSFTTHLMSCCCLVFNLRVLSTPPHWWIISPSAAPLTNCCEPGFSSGGSYTYLCSQFLFRVANCCLVRVRPRAGGNPWLVLTQAAPADLALWVRLLLCLWASLMILCAICIGNAGLLHPRLSDDCEYGRLVFFPDVKQVGLD